MSAIDNPAAFPSVALGDPGHPSSAPGMTLRDWIAGQALPAIIAATSAGHHQPHVKAGETEMAPAIARNAYAMADAMLAARGDA